MDEPLTIGVLMDYFSPGVVEGAAAYARHHGLRIDPRWSVRADWMPGQPGWDAAILSIVDSEGAQKRAERMEIPIVHLGVWRARVTPRVQVDYVGCGVMAGEEFSDLGLSRVFVLPLDYDPMDRRCVAGLGIAAKRRGMEIQVCESWLDRGGFFDAGVQQIAGELAAETEPVGLFCTHAGMLFSILSELLKLGVKVPDDVALISLEKDVQQTAALAPVPVTGVVPDHWQQGYEAARMAHVLLVGRWPERSVVRIPPDRIERRESTGTSVTQDPGVSKALHGIRTFELRRLTVEDVVRYAGVSRRWLEQRFRKETGRSLHQEITRRRMDEARRLLRSGDLAIVEIAEHCGYSGVHYFSTAFKREMGKPPSAFRKG